jgi:hypothetical protein
VWEAIVKPKANVIQSVSRGVDWIIAVPIGQVRMNDDLTLPEWLHDIGTSSLDGRGRELNSYSVPWVVA